MARGSYFPMRLPQISRDAGLALTLWCAAAVASAQPAAAPSAKEKEPTAPAAAPSSSTVENSVVKIFSTVRRPDLGKPWTKQSPTEISGSGIVIEGKRILTNAHVVLYASQVQVQANQSGDKVSATVEMVAPGIDLAVLKLEDASFFDSHPPLERATAVPEIKDPVLVYGFPTGGTSLSITKGIVSRIDFASYNFPTSGLRVQIDAAINPGNSGGPALVGDKVIGLAFSHLTNAQNIGYIIPCEEIELFLKDIADGKYDGKPALFDEYQVLENPALRGYLKLEKGVEGVVVREPFDNAPSYPLKQWDVVTKIGDTPIDVQGMVKVGKNLRVRFGYLVQQIARDGKVPLTLLRAGKEMTVQLPVSPNRPKLLPFLLGTYPSYFVFGPIVFSNATEEILAGFTAGTNGPMMNTMFSMSGSPLVARRGDKPAFPGEELVIVPAPFFPHKVSKGYISPAARIVESINGTAVKNLAHLVELLRDAKGEFVVIAFAGRGSEAVILPRAEAQQATEEILSDNGVRAQGSADTLAVWNTRAPAK